MKQLHFSIMLSILLSIFVVQSYAHDIEVKNADGVSIYYKLMNGKKEVAVSFRGDRYDSYSYEYQGDVVIPEYVIYGGEKYLVTSIGERAFYDCKVLSSVVIPKSVTFIGNSAFVNCTSITSLAIPNSVTFIGNSAFSGCKGITSLTIPNGVTYIDIGAFGGCTGITSVTIPESVTYIGSNVFYGCSSLIKMQVEVGNRIYDSRENCNAIIETATNTLIAACQTTTSIPNTITAIGTSAFSGTDITSLTIPNSVTSIRESAFQGCKMLTSLSIPNTVSMIDIEVFAGCSALTYISIPNSVTAIGEAAFWGCTNLTSIVIPNSVISIERWAFSGCTNLASVTLGNRVLSLGYAAFGQCASLTSVTLPNSVISIGRFCFDGCKALKEVICLAEKVPSYAYDSYEISSIHRNAILKVPENSIDLYKSQKPWSDFGKIVVYSPDNEAANSVIAMIKAIGKVVYTDVSKARIDAARKAYEALTDVQKALVTNVETLIAAETKYLELQEMATGINVVSADDTGNIWYDLSGRKLSQKPVTKGVYIQNGKTVLIK